MNKTMTSGDYDRLRFWLTYVIFDIMMEDFGVRRQEVKDHFTIDIIPYSGRVVVELDVPNDQLPIIKDSLDYVIQMYDRDAEFERVAPGVFESQVDADYQGEDENE